MPIIGVHTHANQIRVRRVEVRTCGRPAIAITWVVSSFSIMPVSRICDFSDSAKSWSDRPCRVIIGQSGKMWKHVGWMSGGDAENLNWAPMAGPSRKVLVPHVLPTLQYYAVSRLFMKYARWYLCLGSSTFSLNSLLCYTRLDLVKKAMSLLYF